MNILAYEPSIVGKLSQYIHPSIIHTTIQIHYIMVHSFQLRVSSSSNTIRLMLLGVIV